MPKAGTVRIIAGKWRGRKLQVPEVKGLRPTPDRVRVTIFNWLDALIPGANCLDLFAGSGVLGFEALSRGALHVTLIDQSPIVITLLQKELKEFGGENATVYQATIPHGLPKFNRPFDIIFLDPPYQENLLLASCEYLEVHHYLAETAYVYLEAPKMINDNELPENWQVIKMKQAGQVIYHLVKRVK